MSTIKQIICLFSLILTASGITASGRDSLVSGGQFERSVQRMMNRAFSKEKGQPSDYVISDDQADLQQQYVNGASPLYGDDVKTGLTNSLNTFNTANTSKGVKMFVFTGRYYLGYSDIHGINDQSANVTRIMNGLSSALQNQAGPDGSKQIFRKNFIQVLDDQYAAFQQSATTLGKTKVIVLFYVEAVIGYDYLLNNKIAPVQKKHYYGFIWTGGMDIFEQSALSTSLSSFQQLLQLDPKQGLVNPQGLVSCVDKVNQLYQSTVNYDDPTQAINLVWNLSNDQLQALTVAERIRLLKAMDKASSLTDANNVFAVGSTGFSGEQAVVKVASTVPDAESKEWMASLQTNTQLVVDLLSKLDNAGMGDNNYTSLVNALLHHFYAQVPFNDDWSQFNSDTRSFKFNGFGMWQGIAYTMSERPELGDIGGVIHEPTPDGLGYKGYSLGPFDYIGLLSTQALPGLNYSQGLPNGHFMCAVPAFYLSWVLNLKTNANTQQLAMLTIAIPGNALVFGGGMALLGSSSWIVRTIGYLDILTSVSSTILQTTPLKQSIGDKYGTSSTQYKIISDVDLAMGLYNSARLVVDLAQIPPKLDEAAALWKTGRDNMVRNGDVTEQQAQEMDKMLNQNQNGGEPPASTPPPAAVVHPPGWVEVLDIRTKITNRASHVLEVEWTSGSSATEFGGFHSRMAGDDFVAQTPGSTFTLNDQTMEVINGVQTGVYEAKPVITIRNADGTITTLTKKGNGGVSSLFPDTWDKARVLDEVEYAIANNHGLARGGSPNEYYGFSRDGTIEIHFYLKPNGYIPSYFPKKR